MRRYPVLPLLCLAFSGALACKTSSEPTVPSCGDTAFAAGGGVVVSVTSGTSPRFTWDPACRAYALSVTDSIGTLMWGLVSDSGSTMLPGITYGAVPAGGYTQMQAPVALQTGKSYSVYVFRAYFNAPTQEDVVGAKAFRP